MKQATTANGVAAQEHIAAALDTEDAAADAFLSKWMEEDGESLSETPEEEHEELTEEEGSQEEVADEAVEDEGSEDDHQENTEETNDEETSEEDSDESNEDEEPAKVLGDEAVVKVKVDGEELDVSVKELKRLYGQEKALTRKTQEVAAKRKEADATAAKLNASYEKLYNKAAERFKPYAEIDMLVASKQLDAEQFAALRKEAQAAYEDFRFISEEADAFVKTQQEEAQRNLRTAAAESIKTLKADIPNWSQSLYDQIREYAIGKGIDANVVNNMVDPVSIKILHQARLYEESKKIATKKKVTPAPKKVLKAKASTSVKDTKGNTAGAAKAKLLATGSVDDATNLFMARWASDEE